MYKQYNDSGGYTLFVKEYEIPPCPLELDVFPPRNLEAFKIATAHIIDRTFFVLARSHRQPVEREADVLSAIKKEIIKPQGQSEYFQSGAEVYCRPRTLFCVLFKRIYVDRDTGQKMRSIESRLRLALRFKFTFTRADNLSYFFIELKDAYIYRSDTEAPVCNWKSYSHWYSTSSYDGIELE